MQRDSQPHGEIAGKMMHGNHICDRYFHDQKIESFAQEPFTYVFFGSSHCNYGLVLQFIFLNSILPQAAELINKPQQFNFTFTFQSPNERQTRRKWSLSCNYCNQMFLAERITRVLPFSNFHRCKAFRPPIGFKLLINTCIN